MRGLRGLSSAAFGAVLTASAAGGIVGAVVGPSMVARIPPRMTIAVVLCGHAAVLVAIALMPRGIMPIGTGRGGLVVAVAEPAVGRDWALRSTFVVSALIVLAC